MNYPLEYPDYVFRLVIYSVFENEGSKSYRKECFGSAEIKKAEPSLPALFLTGRCDRTLARTTTIELNLNFCFGDRHSRRHSINEIWSEAHWIRPQR